MKHLAAGLAALALSSVALLAAACGAADSVVNGEPADTGGWRDLPRGPLSPREAPTGIWTGTEVLLIGGSDAPPCPPNAACVPAEEPPLADGAAFDPATGAWRPIADAPVAVGWADAEVVGSTAYLWARTGQPGDAAFLAYSIEEDRWRRLPLPPGKPEHFHAVVAAGDRIVAYTGSDEQGERADAVFDPATGKWARLPDDPLSPSFDRWMAWSGQELILFDHELVPNPGSEEPALTRAAAFDFDTGAWRVLPESEQLGTGPWVRSEGRLVSPMLGSADGGAENGWGRSYPYGGILDPASGRWSPLPDPPGGESAFAAGVVTERGAEYYAPEGWVLDTMRGTWTEIPPQEEGGLVTGRTVVAAGDDLFVFGGARWKQNGVEATLLGDASLWVASPARW